MSSSKAFTISYKNDDSWFAQVGPQLKATFDNDKLSFDNEIGKGDFYRVDIDLGLRVRKVEVVFHKTVIFKRKSTQNAGYYVLVSNLSEQYLETETGQQQFNLGYGSENGLYFSSPQLTTTYTFHPGIHYRLVFIILSQERIRNFIARQPEAQRELLFSFVDESRPVYYVECLDAHSLNLLKEIDKNLHDDRGNNLLIHARTLELCYYTLQRVQQRHSKSQSIGIHRDDIVSLNEIRRGLLESYRESCPPISEAARKASMSPTKFKTLFKQMFGHSYYQFYKNVRMHKAKELLLVQKMNVSEVGYLLGYNNLSKFTRAFKHVFAVTPGRLTNP